MEIREYYQLLTEYHATLRSFRTWNTLWKASVLVAEDPASDVDVGAERLAASSWERLEGLHTRLAGLHKVLAIPAPLPQLPLDEWEERVVPLAQQGGDDADKA